MLQRYATIHTILIYASISYQYVSASVSTSVEISDRHGPLYKRLIFEKIIIQALHLTTFCVKDTVIVGHQERWCIEIYALGRSLNTAWIDLRPFDLSSTF